MSAQIKDGGVVDVLAVLDAASATFDNIRFERRHESTELQIEFWSRRIAEVIAARAAVAELIDKADTAATALSNLIAAGQVDAGYSGHVTDLTAALANVGGAK